MQNTPSNKYNFSFTWIIQRGYQEAIYFFVLSFLIQAFGDYVNPIYYGHIETYHLVIFLAFLELLFNQVDLW